jgi:hypothetical protein
VRGDGERLLHAGERTLLVSRVSPGRPSGMTSMRMTMHEEDVTVFKTTVDVIYI